MSFDEKKIDLRIRTRYEGKRTLTELVDQIQTLGKALDKQQSDADKGAAGIKALEAGYQKLVGSLQGVQAAFNATLRYERQEAALAKVSGRLDGARQKLDAFNASLSKGDAITDKQVNQQFKLAAAVDRAAAAQEKAKNRLAETAASLSRYGIEATKIADAQRQMAGVISRGNTALKSQEEAIDRVALAQNKLAGSNVGASLERIQQHVIGLAAAYVGLHQGAGLATSSVDAFSAREGVKNQLALAFGNNQDTVDREYDYIRGQADRIGIELDRASKSYAKFATSAAMAGKAQQEIQYIWESFAEVGRIANLSGDDFDGVFKALEQITSKGKIQAEELRGQLGDRLFGAFQIAAKALKDTFPDLDAALKGGEVTADQLLKIAEEYRKTVADQLPAATKSLAAEQARLNNAILDFKLAIADAGFADRFRTLLERLTEALKGDDGKKFAEALSTAFSTVADALVWLSENIDTVTNALKALIALYAINTAGKAAKGVADYADALKTLTTEAKITIKELGLLRGAFAVLQAGLSGFAIGTWAQEEFETVRKAGVAMVTGIEMLWARLRAGAAILYEELPRHARNAMIAALNALTWGTRQMLTVMQKGLEAIGQTDLARTVGNTIAKLTWTYEEQSGRIAEVNKGLAADLQRIRDIGQDMWNDAERRKPAKVMSTTSPTERPQTDSTPKGKIPTEADLAKRQRLVDEITRALDTIDTKVDRAQTHSLQAQLDAIDSQYRELGKKIAAVGGTAGDEFGRRLSDSLSQLRAQVIAKFNKELGDERAALAARLDAVDAAAGRRTVGDIEARLGAIRTQYESTYREIEEFRARLATNGMPPQEADEAKSRLDAGIAELQQLETQKFYRDELRRQEAEVNHLLDIRAERLKSIADQEAGSLITSADARAQTEAAITTLQPQIQTMVDSAVAFAESLRGAFDPLIIDAFIARLETIKGSAKGLGDNFKLTAKQVDDMLGTRATQAFDEMAKSLGGAVAGQKSWNDAIKDSGRAFLQFAADFIREISLMIIKAMVLKAIQSSGAGGWIGTAVNAAVKHEGGLVDGGGRKRSASPFMFVGAPRYHTGGIAGLAPNEYPAILKKNEEVLTEDDPRNILNRGAVGGGQPTMQDVTVANYVDAESFMQSALAKPTGRKLIMNVLSAERSALRTLVGAKG
ncbi:MAG: tape measure protein [Azonexaceae bacterium]|nr:tape measure protein [Azonexaceae bacterium]